MPARPLIGPLHLDEVPRVGECLERAFVDDPMTGFLFGGDPKLSRKLRWVFQASLRYALRHGVVDAVPDALAVAMWLPPGRSRRASLDMLRSGIITAPMRLGLGAAWRVAALMRGMQSLHTCMGSQPHWYLLTLAVHPDHQGRGFGGRLVRHGLSRAEREGLPCYLETSNPKNIAFYERLGFRVTATGCPRPGGVTIWGMVARPS